MIDLWFKTQVNVRETFHQYRNGLPGDMVVKPAKALVQGPGVVFVEDTGLSKATELRRTSVDRSNQRFGNKCNSKHRSNVESATEISQDRCSSEIRAGIGRAPSGRSAKEQQIWLTAARNRQRHVPEKIARSIIQQSLMDVANCDGSAYLLFERRGLEDPWEDGHAPST